MRRDCRIRRRMIQGPVEGGVLEEPQAFAVVLTSIHHDPAAALVGGPDDKALVSGKGTKKGVLPGREVARPVAGVVREQ